MGCQPCQLPFQLPTDKALKPFWVWLKTNLTCSRLLKLYEPPRLSFPKILPKFKFFWTYLSQNIFLINFFFLKDGKSIISQAISTGQLPILSLLLEVKDAANLIDEETVKSAVESESIMDKLLVSIGDESKVSKPSKKKLVDFFITFFISQIKTGIKKFSKTWDLSNRNLISIRFPDSSQKLKRLRNLILSHNNLIQIPLSIFKVPKLGKKKNLFGHVGKFFFWFVKFTRKIFFFLILCDVTIETIKLDQNQILQISTEDIKVLRGYSRDRKKPIDFDMQKNQVMLRHRYFVVLRLFLVLVLERRKFFSYFFFWTWCHSWLPSHRNYFRFATCHARRLGTHSSQVCFTPRGSLELNPLAFNCLLLMPCKGVATNSHFAKLLLPNLRLRCYKYSDFCEMLFLLLNFTCFFFLPRCYKFWFLRNASNFVLLNFWIFFFFCRYVFLSVILLMCGYLFQDHVETEWVSLFVLIAFYGTLLLGATFLGQLLNN